MNGEVNGEVNVLGTLQYFIFFGFIIFIVLRASLKLVKNEKGIILSTILEMIFSLYILILTIYGLTVYGTFNEFEVYTNILILFALLFGVYFIIKTIKLVKLIKDSP